MADFNSDNQRTDDGVAAIRTLLDAHAAANGAHITQAERDKLAALPVFSIHTYAGNDENNRRIVLGFQPRFGFVFADDRPFGENTSWIPSIAHRAGFFSQSGSSESVRLESDGILVRSFPNTCPNGNRPALNQNGVNYVIVAAR
jgi:hypothetical protein